MIRKMHFRLCVAMGDISNILGGALGYSWDIRGIFGEYSWDIRMYRVCVGNVSGMYRLRVETDEERKRKKKCIFLEKNLVMSGDFCTFAGESGKRG